MVETMLKRKNYWSLDIAKFFCAILIISAHFAAEWGKFPTIIDYAFSLYVIAVPFFFCCSGFLFFKKLNALPTKKDKNNYLLKYEKRIWVMYGLWSVVYFISLLYDWIVIDKDFGIYRLLNYLHQVLVYSTYSTIWFLPALAIGVAITYFLVNRFTKRQIMIVAVLLYVFGMFGYTYSFIIKDTNIYNIFYYYNKVFMTTRNGVFNGVPFVFMGYLVSVKNDIIPSVRNFFKYAVPAGISLVLLVVEAFILKLKFNVTGMDIGIFIVPFTYFFIMAVLHIELKECKWWLWFRKLSLLMFVSQRLFLTVLPTFFLNFFNAVYSNSYIGLIAVIGMTVIFSIAMILLSNKIEFLKKMI